MSKGLVRLSAITAKYIASQLLPGVKLVRDNTVQSVAIYRGNSGSDGLAIRIENDWNYKDGMIHVTVSDPGGMGHIERTYNSDTLERNIDAEEDMRRKYSRQERIEWVCSVGPEMAHRLVDKYWEAGKE